MKTYKMKMSIPKVGVLATGLIAAILVGTNNMAPAQALPTYGTCTDCHTAGGSVSATPSSATLAPGAAYTVAIAVTTTNTGNAGYAIYASDMSGMMGASVTTGGPSAGTTFSAPMTAPATAGTYYYKVWANKGTPPGAASSVDFSITVAAAPATTPPVTTPPVTTPPVTTPPAATPPVTTPPVTTPPAATPPVTTPPAATPPAATPPVTPHASIAHISKLSVRHGAVGTKVTIRGTDFGAPGSAEFGTTTAKASSWTSTAIVVTVPAYPGAMMPLSSAVTVPVWYRHVEDFSVTVTPAGAAASNAVSFRLDPRRHHGDHASVQAPRHHVWHAGHSS